MIETRAVTIAVWTALTFGTAPAQCQQQRDAIRDSYPTRPIRIVVGNPPGGGVDIVARVIGQKLAERWGHPVVIDNRAGAAGIISMDTVASATPDGHTLLGGSGSMILLGVRKKVAYDIRKTFVPVSQMSTTPYLLVVTPSLPVKSVKELVAYAKTRSLTYASSGTGSAVHLGMELFGSMTGIQMVHVPYKGSSQSLIDIAGGRVQPAITNILSGAPLVKNGQIKALAVTSLKRASTFPGLPTVAEAGMPGYEVTNSYYLYAPWKTSPRILAVLNAEIGQITTATDVKQRLAAEGAEPAAPASLPELRQNFLAQVGLWEKFISASGVKLAD
jgi:tripartite-type tricarboxylate transporter receptor subunit TctC